MALEHDDLERGALLASPTASPKPVQPAPATPDRSVAWRVFWTLAFYAPSAALPLAARLLVVYREDAVMSLASLLKSAAFGCMQDAAVFLQTLVVARLVLYFRDLLTCSRNVYRSVLVHFVAAFALAFAYMWMTLACVVDLSLLLQFLPRLNRGFVKMYIHFSAQFASSINDVISVQMVAGFSLYVLSMVLWVVSVLFDKAHLPQFGIVFCQTGRSVSTPLAAATSTEPSQVKSQGKAPRRPSVSVSNAGLFPCFIHLVTTSLTLRTLVIALMTSVSALHATLALDGNGSDIYLMSNAMFSLEMDDFLKPSASSESGTHALDSKTLPHMRDFAAIVDRLIGPNEVFLVADKNGHYPLWRKTVGYKGEKRFNVKKSKTPPTVLLFNIESFRAREVGVIGGREKKALYNQTVTPFFDELSRSGVLFRQHYTPSIQTSRTMMSTLFGVLPSLTDATAVAKFGERKTRLHGITHILKKFANYKTMFWSAVDLRWEDWKGFFRANGFDQLVGETEVLDHLTPERRKSLTDAERFSWGRHDPVSFDALENFLEQRQKDESASKQPLFMDIYSITSHDPWPRPPNFEASTNYSAFVTKDNANYVNSINFVDRHLSKLITNLRKKNLLKNTIVLIEGDHGYGRMEHGNNPTIASSKVFEEAVHIPLLILADDLLEEQSKGTVVDEPTSQTDLLATIADMLGVKGFMQHGIGHSMVRKNSGKTERGVVLENPYEGKTTGLRVGLDLKYVRYGSGKYRVFNLTSDPDERHPVEEGTVDAFHNAKSEEEITYLDRVVNLGQLLYETNGFMPPSKEEKKEEKKKEEEKKEKKKVFKVKKKKN